VDVDVIVVVDVDVHVDGSVDVDGFCSRSGLEKLGGES
jgi:hypothetical protein